MISKGFFEISTNSLTKSVFSEKAPFLDPNEDVVILNKLSEDLGVLRQSLIFSGLEVVAHNINRKQNNIKIFEFGTVYKKKPNGKYEEKFLGIWMTGKNQSESWIEKNKVIEFMIYHRQ